MSSVYAWDVIAANNANADPSINWAEGMPPSDVNDSARVMMARIKQFIIDIGGGTTATGTANAIAATAQSAIVTYANGFMLAFRAIADNTGTATLNVNSIGARPILRATSGGIVPLIGREIKAGGIYYVQYSTALNSGNGAWLLSNPSVRAGDPGDIKFTAASVAPEGWLLCYGQAVSRTEYADLFAAVGTTYGAGNGSTTFNVPDGRGRAPAGKDNMGGSSANRLSTISGNTLGATGGDQSHTLTIAQMPAHNHGGATGAAGTHNHTISGTANSAGAHSHSGSTNSAGAHDHTLTRNRAGIGGDDGPSAPTWNVKQFNAYGPFAAGTSTDGAHSHTISTNTTGAHTHSLSGSTSTETSHTHGIASQGSGQAHNNVQPTIVFNMLIKT